MNNDFCSGFLIGFLTAGIIGFLLQQFYLAYIRIRAAFRPQIITAATRRTPAEVVAASIQAGCLLVVAILLIGLILWFLLDSL